MIGDKLNTFGEALALNTGGAGSYIIGDQIDLGVDRNIGVAPGLGQLYLVITVDTAATSGGSATGQFSLVTDADPALGSPVVIFSTPAFAVANMTAGAILAVVALPVSDAYERYIGIQQTTGTAAFTAGKINAFLTHTPPARRAYPQGDGAAL